MPNRANRNSSSSSPVSQLFLTSNLENWTPLLSAEISRGWKKLSEFDLARATAEIWCSYGPSYKDVERWFSNQSLYVVIASYLHSRLLEDSFKEIYVRESVADSLKQSEGSGDYSIPLLVCSLMGALSTIWRIHARKERLRVCHFSRWVYANVDSKIITQLNFLVCSQKKT